MRFSYVPLFAFMALAVWLLAGCTGVEPYPGWEIKNVAFGDMPVVSQKAFHQDFPEAHVIKIERGVFKSPLNGCHELFRLSFRAAAGQVQHAVYDLAGKRQDQLDFWFERQP